MEEQNDVKVSIVVPVYNVPEKALRACIESCIAQTLQDIEIILVDDGSTDNSGMICDEYAQREKRIIVIHKENGGLSAARNTGYRNATGEWITFLDSDDWIEPHTCEDTYCLGIENNVDVVIFGTIQEFENYTNRFRYHYNDGTVFYGEECKELQCEILNFTGNIATAWAKLIRRSVLDRYGIEHNSELRQGSEGIEFNLRLFACVEKVYFTDKVYYHYIYNPNSISAKHDEKNHYFVIKCFEEMKRQILKDNNKDRLLQELYNRFLYVIISTAISGYFSPLNKQNFKQKCESYNTYLSNSFVKEVFVFADSKQLDIKRKLVYLLVKRKLYFVISILSKMRYAEKH